MSKRSSMASTGRRGRGRSITQNNTPNSHSHSLPGFSALSKPLSITEFAESPAPPEFRVVSEMCVESIFLLFFPALMVNGIERRAVPVRHLRAWGETNTDLFSFPQSPLPPKDGGETTNKRMNFVFRNCPVESGTRKRDLLFSASLVSGLTASFVFQRAEIAIVRGFSSLVCLTLDLHFFKGQ